MIRSGYEAADIQKAVTDFLRSKAAAVAPWSSWSVVEGWPGSTVFENFKKLFLYSHAPILFQTDLHQAGRARKVYEMVVGAWSCSASGGREEAAIAQSALINLFEDPATNAVRFNSTVGGTVNTNKTFLEIGMTVEGVINPRAINVVSEDDFRAEISLVISI